MHRIALLFIFLLVMPAAFASTPATPLPGDSVLQLPGAFTAQDGKAFKLADRRGHPQLVTMFYSSCQYMCPLIVTAGLGVEKSLTANERAKLRVLMISLDPGRDSPPVLSALAKKRNLDTARWTLARTDEATVRKSAALLGVRYRRLEDGEFNHSSAWVLLDGQGRILARTEKMTAVPDPEFLAKVRLALK